MSIRIDINVCRVCCKAEAPHSILQHATKFQYCTALQISEHDGLPTKICDGCLGRMRVAVEFKRKSESSDRHLRSFIDKVNSQFHLALEGPSDDEGEDIDVDLEGKVLVEVASSEKIPMCTIPGKQEVEQSMGHAEQEPKQELEKFRAVAVIQEKPVTPPPPLVKPERDEVDIVELEYEDEIPLEEMEPEEEQEQNEADEELIYIDLPADYQQHQDEEELVQPMEESGHESVEVYEIHDSQSDTLEVQQTTPKRRAPKTPRPKTSESEKSTTSRFECTQCNKIFSTRTNLNRHLLTHDGNKPYTCLLCHKGFTQSGSLKQHLLIHQNLRPHVCSECGQGFTQQKSLTFHMRRHTNEKPFTCSFCGYAFRQKDGLKRHVAVKHSENNTRDFACDICPKTFKTKHVLTVHRRKHNGERNDGTAKEGEVEQSSGEMVVTVVREIDE